MINVRESVFLLFSALHFFQCRERLGVEGGYSQGKLVQDKTLMQKTNLTGSEKPAERVLFWPNILNINCIKS